MRGRGALIVLLPVFVLTAVEPGGRAGQPASTPATRENIEAALRLTLAAAAEYDIQVGTDEKPLALHREPVLKWSNPVRGEVHGNVFLWTRAGRPLVVGSLYKWFGPFKHMSHEFQSFAEQPIDAKFHGTPVWKTTETAVQFTDLPGAPAPATTEALRVSQLRQLAKDFSGSKEGERDLPGEIVLRLLPQPIYRYAVPNEGVQTGGLFTLVHGTDPEIFLLIEARGKDVASAKWQYAATRMNSVLLRLRYRDKQLWSGENLRWAYVRSHDHPYTIFQFDMVPDFLTDAIAKPKP